MAAGSETQTLDPAREPTAPASYVLVVDSESSRRVPTPDDGVLRIGRSQDADIQITSDAVSRTHAKLVFISGRARIEDLGSHNGTLVNGERVTGACALASGDVIAIADTRLILRAGKAAWLERPLELDQMRCRIDQEIARATDYDRPFSVVAVRAADGIANAGGAARAVLRPMDVVCVNGASVIALLPELDPQAGREQGAMLVDALGGKDARGGVASYPADGGDTATLLTAARGALAIAGAGELATAAMAATELAVGDQVVLVADPAMRRLYDLLRRLARSGIAALITGETGSGKENAAAALHHWSPRAPGPFVSLNCAALPESLAESELFGYERGAFSDARAPKPGLFERAHGGTLFLDEVGDLSLGVQAKLLRALESQRITRLGDVRERTVDVRVVAATNVDLDGAVAQQRFRQDLLFRLGAATVAIPPLRHRPQEIPLLARMFAKLECGRLARSPLELSESALAALARYAFPGNVRELKNAMEFAVATAEGDAIYASDLPSRLTGADAAGEAPAKAFRPIADELRELERRRIIEALDACGGVQTRAAAAIGMPLRTFTFRMKQYRVEPRERAG